MNTDQPIPIPATPVLKRGAIRSLADHVYAELRADIVRGQLKPGARLVELELAEQAGTSQGPVREALQRLEREGLVYRQARSATYVTDISIDEMYALFSVRSVIEGFAARRTAVRYTPAHNSILVDLVAGMRSAGLDGDMFALTEADLQFHRHVMIWAESVSLLRAWNPLYSQIQRFVIHTHVDHFPHLTEIADTHQPVLDAFNSRDGDQAARAMEEHIMLIWSRMKPNDQLEERSA